MSSRTVSYSSNLTVAPAIFWAFLLASLAIRLYAVIISPLEPSVDEAQYWLWGQTPQLGYYSKPPLIAWILAGTSSLFDHQNFGQLLALRISAPLIHTLTALCLWQTGRLLFSDNAGRLAAVLWISLCQLIRLCCCSGARDYTVLSALMKLFIRIITGWDWSAFVLGWPRYQNMQASISFYL